MDDRFERFVRDQFRAAGRQYARAKRAYDDGRDASQSAHPDLPRDEEGRVRLVCRRHAERRAVGLDESGLPACFEADHPDCEGCAEDVRSGVVETW
ncbi:hypothetical protein NDI76_02235 [Halogeometricum sp. S1BR25-6]|uniref:Uncharacterized protein n=1 Tax=Halogeometricum salsisoli TaxID=2950536 RepID=A0ABU2GB65_9EURY|nr:hypothetical protein [Halogeometricum sp. S1BR25-6]MDS0297559.1 hypothetical protein [Halogeometricum sp. S1BR25-6]